MFLLEKSHYFIEHFITFYYYSLWIVGQTARGVFRGVFLNTPLCKQIRSFFKTCRVFGLFKVPQNSKKFYKFQKLFILNICVPYISSNLYPMGTYLQKPNQKPSRCWKKNKAIMPNLSDRVFNFISSSHRFSLLI